MTTHLGQAIREQRLAAGMTQAALAKAVGIARYSLIRYETGQRVPELHTFVRLGRALGSIGADIALGRAVAQDVAEMDADA